MRFNPPVRAFALFYKTPVAFYGERAGMRKVAMVLKCLVIEDSALTVADSAAPVHARAFVVASASTASVT